ncbi:50S ribosome-binding GTPase [Candidatus Bathyarchaeota archaeon]|nr:50S ribosome-binding GTPase [Candidatus Bathyarchaeota archaeon]
MAEGYFVFTGRPNSGKSSLIKAITGINVAVGKQPGTTNRIEKYPLSKNLLLIDMPGYGVSLRLSKQGEEDTKDMILDFLKNKSNQIILALHVINTSTYLETETRLAKKGFIPLDIELVHYIKRDLNITCIVAANKIDKERSSIINENLEALKEGLGPTIPVYPVSAKTGDGIGLLKNDIRKRLIEHGYTNPFELVK